MQVFAKETSIHGLRFILERGHTSFTKLFWSISFIASLCGFSFYLYEAYVKLNLKPDIVLKSTQTQMREIPFPAITFCTPLFMRSSILPNVRADFYLVNEVQRFSYIANLLRTDVPSTDIYRNYNFTSDRIIHYLNISSLEVDELFTDCGFHLEFFPCSKMFRKVLTNEGFCYTFNAEGLGSNFTNLSDDLLFYKYDTKKIWSPDKGFFDERDDELTPPVRASKKHLIMFSLRMNNSDVENYSLSKSYSWALHLPNEIFTPFHKMRSLSFLQVILIFLVSIIKYNFVL